FSQNRDAGKARFQAFLVMSVNGKAVESLRKKTLDFQSREAYNRFAKTLFSQNRDAGKARFQAFLVMSVNGKAVESLRKKTLDFQSREAYK
ncbi:MAG: hypothetical protein ACOZBZ_01880, partial [Patescibacteria group bacterium]